MNSYTISNALQIFHKDDFSTQTTVSIPAIEAMAINSKNMFELAIVLKKKENSKPLLQKAIIDRIEEKIGVLKSINDADTICFIGHSQIDNWDIDTISGYKVQNCGIRGISSFEYTKYILNKEYLHCNADIYIVMHGTNDIVTDSSDEEIIDSIKHTIDYIYTRNASARIYFLECAHVNGRLDRSNKRIESFNKKLRERLNGLVICVSLNALNDVYGDLKAEYTNDGLHFTEKAYSKLKEIIEFYIERHEKI